MTPEEALLAIIARVDGEWDNITLMEFGLLSANPLEDIREIVELGLGL